MRAERERWRAGRRAYEDVTADEPLTVPFETTLRTDPTVVDGERNQARSAVVAAPGTEYPTLNERWLLATASEAIYPKFPFCLRSSFDGNHILSIVMSPEKSALSGVVPSGKI